MPSTAERRMRVQAWFGKRQQAVTYDRRAPARLSDTRQQGQSVNGGLDDQRRLVSLTPELSCERIIAKWQRAKRAATLRQSARQLQRSFYESECQGRASSPLISEAASPWHSAPPSSTPRPTDRGALGVQSSSASCASLGLQFHLTTFKRAGRDRRTMVLSETRQA